MSNRGSSGARGPLRLFQEGCTRIRTHVARKLHGRSQEERATLGTVRVLILSSDDGSNVIPRRACPGLAGLRPHTYQPEPFMSILVFTHLPNTLDCLAGTRLVLSTLAGAFWGRVQDNTPNFQDGTCLLFHHRHAYHSVAYEGFIPPKIGGVRD